MLTLKLMASISKLWVLEPILPVLEIKLILPAVNTSPLALDAKVPVPDAVKSIDPEPVSDPTLKAPLTKIEPAVAFDMAIFKTPLGPMAKLELLTFNTPL